ncbi:hypothetical protein GOBAR_DD18216 [Gossypium barbadense]|nr:hypothetical protein GOBAR_DD18216 [Gossypium barbadense]
MESSKIYGGIEECHSSESGWTMYIGSPIHGGDDSGDGHSEKADDEGVYGVDNHADEQADSDDSMASDASSASLQGKHHYRGGSIKEGGGDTLSCTWGEANFSNLAKDLDSSKTAKPLANSTATGLRTTGPNQYNHVPFR